LLSRLRQTGGDNSLFGGPTSTLSCYRKVMIDTTTIIIDATIKMVLDNTRWCVRSYIAPGTVNGAMKAVAVAIPSPTWQQRHLLLHRGLLWVHET
jgi:hypothetical protein